MNTPDFDAIENGGKRWHGEDHRVVSVRWEPYKPDGQRQMKAKGRWQEQVGSGDYWRWQNCDRPQNLTPATAPPDPLSDPRVRALVEAAKPFVSQVQNADFARQLRQHETLVDALRAIEEGGE